MQELKHLLGDSSSEEHLFITRDEGLVNEKNDHSVGSTTEVVSPETLPEGEKTLLLENLHTTIPKVLVGHFVGHGVRRHVHETSLHEVEGEGSEGTAEAGNGRGNQVGGEALAEMFIAELLGEIVGSEHTEVHGHGTEDHGKTASPQGHDAFVLGDTEKGVEAVLVATSLLDGTKTIGLHTHHGDIERITNHTGQGTGGEGGESRGEEGNVTIISFLQLVSEHTVETETGSTVDSLSHERSGQTSVKLHNTFVLNQILHDGHGTNVLSLADDLDTGFDKIDGLDLFLTNNVIKHSYTSGSGTGRDTTANEGLTSSHGSLKAYGDNNLIYA